MSCKAKNLQRRYIEHLCNARQRGIPFLLTFEQWAEIWRLSGKWDQRGARKGQYVMARPGDRGAYEVGNVVICRAEENRAERNRNYALSGERNGAFGKNYWAAASGEERKERARRISDKTRGMPKSAAMRAALSKTATGRRRVIVDGRPTWAHPNIGG